MRWQFFKQAHEADEEASNSELRVLRSLRNNLVEATKDKAKLESIINQVLGYLDQRSETIALIQNATQTEAKPHEKPSEGGQSDSRPSSAVNRQAFLRQKSLMLSEYKDFFVAFQDGTLLAAARSLDSLSAKIPDKVLSSGVYIDVVTEEAFSEVPVIELSGVQEVYPSGGSPL
jgi:hypothetical protein